MEGKLDIILKSGKLGSRLSRQNPSSGYKNINGPLYLGSHVPTKKIKEIIEKHNEVISWVANNKSIFEYAQNHNFTNETISGNTKGVVPDGTLEKAIFLHLASMGDFSLLEKIGHKFIKGDDKDEVFLLAGALIGASTNEAANIEKQESVLNWLRYDFNEMIEHREEIFNLIPELRAQYLFESRHPRHTDTLFSHSLKVLQAFPKNNYLLRLAALLHDVAKPYTVNPNGKVNTYHNHNRCGAHLTFNILNRLEFSNGTKQFVSNLVKEHVINYTKIWRDKAVKRFCKRNQTNFDALLALVLSDNQSQEEKPNILSELIDRSYLLNDTTFRDLYINSASLFHATAKCDYQFKTVYNSLVEFASFSGEIRPNSCLIVPMYVGAKKLIEKGLPVVIDRTLCDNEDLNQYHNKKSLKSDETRLYYINSLGELAAKYDGPLILLVDSTDSMHYVIQDKMHEHNKPFTIVKLDHDNLE